MRVATVSASVRFSKALGDGQHKTVELSAEAFLDDEEVWTQAQARLYHELGQQLKTMWVNGTGKGQDVPDKPIAPTPPAPGHWCAAHQTQYKRFSKDGRTWYSHKTPDGKWCKEC
jgi:hypothetical protein